MPDNAPAQQIASAECDDKPFNTGTAPGQRPEQLHGANILANCHLSLFTSTTSIGIILTTFHTPGSQETTGSGWV